MISLKSCKILLSSVFRVKRNHSIVLDFTKIWYHISPGHQNKNIVVSLVNDIHLYFTISFYFSMSNLWHLKDKEMFYLSHLFQRYQLVEDKLIAVAFNVGYIAWSPDDSMICVCGVEKCPEAVVYTVAVNVSTYTTYFYN